MNQNRSTVFYRGVLILVLAGFPLAKLSSMQAPWARHAYAIGQAAWGLGVVGLVIYVNFGKRIRPRQTAMVEERMSPRLDGRPSPRWYEDRWVALARLALAASVSMAVAAVAVLLFVAPPRQCPAWRLPGQHPMSLWLPLLFWMAPVLTAMTFVLVRWRWFIARAIARVDQPTMMPIPDMLAVTVMAGCAMAQAPWALLVTRCWLGP